jgi:hypothetical protein
MLTLKNGLEIKDYWLIQKDENYALYLCKWSKWWYYVVSSLNVDPEHVSQTGNSYDTQNEALDQQQQIIRDWFEE